MITSGNFQDIVQLSADTLYHLGPDLELGNTASASTVSIGFNNTAGNLQLAAAATGNATVWLPAAGGTVLSNINVSAGTTSNFLSAITFSNSNGVSFGLNGSTLTASINPDALAIGAIAAGTQTATSGTVVFSNSNNLSFGMSGSSRITASYNFNISAGTTSGNVNAVTFSNANGVSFGFDGTNVTGSVAASGAAVAFAAGTQTATSGTVDFSNSNNISFGMSGSSRVTVSYNFNISAGTTSNNVNAVTFSNSNGISFGLNGSTITAQNGGISSWSVAGGPATALSNGQNTLHFEAIQIPYAITATNLLFLASISNSTTNVSGGFSLSAALYSLNVSTLSLASSASTNITWTSGAALSSNTGINYQQMSLNSWAITPGPYLLAWWISTQNSASVSYYGPPTQPAIASGLVAAMSTLMLNGYSQATTNALPSSFGISNTASYIRTGATAAQQPYVILQGT